MFEYGLSQKGNLKNDSLSPIVQEYGEDHWKLLPVLESGYMSGRMIWPLVMVVAIRAAT